MSDTIDPKPWSARQRRAAVLLAAGRTAKAAAAAVGVNPRQVRRWRENPAFIAFIAECRGRAYERTLSMLSRASTRAVAKLMRLLEDPSGAVALGAARAILENATKYRESVEGAERLAAMEERLRGMNTSDGGRDRW